MTALLKPQCCGRTKGNLWRDTQCSKTGKIERDGKYYCGTHDPVARKAKYDAVQAKWRAEFDARTKARNEAHEKQKELERRAECFDDFLVALKNCAAVCAGEVVNKNGLINALEMARSAIEKATGEQK